MHRKPLTITSSDPGMIAAVFYADHFFTAEEWGCGAIPPPFVN
jgi:hypothetical protein